MGTVYNLTAGGGGGIRLETIAITAPPAKTCYLAGEAFDPAGMVVTASYSNGAALAATGYAVEPSGPLADGVEAVTVRYTEGGRSAAARQPVTVLPRLLGISVETPPARTEYQVGEVFDPAGMAVSAAYSDGSTRTVEGWTVPTGPFTAPGEQEVAVEYAEHGVTASAVVAVTVARMVIGAAPSQSGSLTYTGEALSPEWADYDPEQLALGGVVSAVGAGTYAAAFTPTERYQWSDGSTGTRSVPWTIGKAAGRLTLTPTELTLSAAAPTGTIQADRAGSGAVSAVSSDESIAVVEVSGTTVAVSSVGQTSGGAVVTVRVEEDENHLAVSGTCRVTAQFTSTVLNENGWEAIRKASDSGDAPNLWSVGDCKSVTLNGTVGSLTLSNYTVYAFILGFNHNEALEGSNRIHFQIGKTAATGGTDVALCDSLYDTQGSSAAFRMNTSMTNRGGWAESYMRKTICSDFKNVISSDLRAILKDVTKYTDNVAGASNKPINITDTLDDFFILSEYEIFGSTNYANTAEADKQAQYDYYKAGNGKVKYKHNNTTTAVKNWIRSPWRITSTSALFVDPTGNLATHNANKSFGFSPCFCV